MVNFHALRRMHVRGFGFVDVEELWCVEGVPERGSAMRYGTTALADMTFGKGNGQG